MTRIEELEYWINAAKKVAQREYDYAYIDGDCTLTVDDSEPPTHDETQTVCVEGVIYVETSYERPSCDTEGGRTIDSIEFDGCITVKNEDMDTIFEQKVKFKL